MKNFDSLIRRALLEDAVNNDITTNLLISHQSVCTASIILKEDAIVCGTDLAAECFKRISKNIQCQILVKDGHKAKKKTPVMKIRGSTRAILSAERTALNFLGHLSGIATQTQRFVSKIKPLKTKIMDTRKTTPGLRFLEKYAVKCGGGVNHRFDLSEAVFIKDNHWQALHNLSIQKLQNIRGKTKKPIIIEVDTLKQFKYILPGLPDVILLDNMTVADMRQAVRINKTLKRRPLLEASGGINLNNVKHIAQTGVDQISIGALTHSVKNIDFSLELK